MCWNWITKTKLKTWLMTYDYALTNHNSSRIRNFYMLVSNFTDSAYVWDAFKLLIAFSLWEEDHWSPNDTPAFAFISAFYAASLLEFRPALMSFRVSPTCALFIAGNKSLILQFNKNTITYMATVSFMYVFDSASKLEKCRFVCQQPNQNEGRSFDAFVYSHEVFW